MNEVIKAIKERRSIRRFKNDVISKENIAAIVEAGIYAPSSLNMQSWHFTVVTKKDLLDKLSEETKKVVLASNNEHIKKLVSNPNFHAFYNAPVGIIVSGEDKAMKPLVACSAAVENMLIAAESLNIGSCWMGVITNLFESKKAEDVKKELGIPEGYTPFYGVALGYVDGEKPQAPPRRTNTVNFI